MDQEQRSLAGLYDFREGRTALLILGYLLVLIPLIALMIWFVFQYGARCVDLINWLIGRIPLFDLISFSLPIAPSAFNVPISYFCAVLALVYGIFGVTMLGQNVLKLKVGDFGAVYLFCGTIDDCL